MDDAALNRLGLRVSVPEQVRPYHRNTTLADIKHHWLGRRVVAAVMGQWQKHLAVGATARSWQNARGNDIVDPPANSSNHVQWRDNAETL